MEREKWNILKKYIEYALAVAENNYESILENQLKLILDYMDTLDEKEKCKQE